MQSRIRLYPVFFLVPALFILTLVVVVPTFQAIILSFQNVNFLYGEDPSYAGLSNYMWMVNDKAFWESVYRSLFFTFGTVLGTVGVGLGAALLLNVSFPLRGFFRTLFLLPWVLPHAVAALSWTWLYDYQFGLVNYFLTKLIPGIDPPLWLGSSSKAMVALVLVSIWKELPFTTVMLLAGLQSIPIELYEASALDGANSWQSFVYVTLPSLKGIAAIITLLQAIWAFKQFPLIYIMTGGGPARGTETLVVNTYRRAFVYFDMGRAATLGVATLLISAVLTIIYFWLTREKKG